MIPLKQSTAITLKLGSFVDRTDAATRETALTIVQADVLLSKNNGAFAQKNDATSGTHDTRGYYSIPLNTTDTNTLGRLQIDIENAAALPVPIECWVYQANVYEALFGGTEFLETTSLRQTFSESGGTLTVKKRDGTTNQFTKSATSDAAAEPIIALG